jgi:hypothetical protein
LPRAPLDDRNPHGSVDAEFPFRGLSRRPRCPAGVTAGPVSPHGVVHPFSVLVGRWGRGGLVAPRSARRQKPSRVRRCGIPRLGWRALQPPEPAAPPRSCRAVGTIRSWVSRSYRVLPSDRRRSVSTVTPCSPSRLPLLGFRSLQRSPVQRVRFSRGFQLPAPCVLGVLTSLDALLPFTPPGHFCPGRSWDCDLQGLVSSRGFPRPFRAGVALLALLDPTPAR